MAVTAFVTIAMITSRSLFSAAAAALALSAALPEGYGGNLNYGTADLVKK